MPSIVAQRAIGITIEQNDAGHAAVLHGHAMGDDGPRADSEQNETLDVPLAGEEIHGGDDVGRGAFLGRSLIVAVRTFTDTGQIDAK